MQKNKNNTQELDNSSMLTNTNEQKSDMQKIDILPIYKQIKFWIYDILNDNQTTIIAIKNKY